MASPSCPVRAFRPAQQNLLVLLVVALLTAVLVGCGGGGGGDSREPVGFTYQTDWTNWQATVGGQSQRLRLLDAAGLVQYETIVNQDVAGVQVQTLESVPRGAFRIVVELFSGRTATGVRNGILESNLVVGSGSVFKTVVGVDPSTVKVDPPTAELEIPKTLTFVATPMGPDGTPTFVKPGDLKWSSSSAALTIDAEGHATAVTPGQATVAASDARTGATGLAQVQVVTRTNPRTKWTIFVFLNAANDLGNFSIEDVNEMEREVGADVRVVVQWKLVPGISPGAIFDGTRRYRIVSDSSDQIRSELVQDLGGGVNMGSAFTLRTFLNWGLANYPSDRYGVIVWNHGNGWRRSVDGSESRAVSYDEQTGSAIQIWQLPDAFQGQHYEFIAWDASLMQMLEVAYEARNYADFIVGSEESPPGQGYPYDRVLRRFSESPDASTQVLTKAFVDAMIAEPEYATRKITQSVLRSSSLPNLAQALSSFGSSLAANRSAIQSLMPGIRANTQSYSPVGSRYFYDLYDFALNVEASVGVPAVVAQAAAVRGAISDAVVHEGHNTYSPRSYGVAIDLTPGSAWTVTSRTDYLRLGLSDATLWDEWLFDSP